MPSYETTTMIGHLQCALLLEGRNSSVEIQFFGKKLIVEDLKWALVARIQAAAKDRDHQDKWLFTS